MVVSIALNVIVDSVLRTRKSALPNWSDFFFNEQVILFVKTKFLYLRTN